MTAICYGAEIDKLSQSYNTRYFDVRFITKKVWNVFHLLRLFF